MSEEISVHATAMENAVDPDVGAQLRVEDQILPADDVAVAGLAKTIIPGARSSRGKCRETLEFPHDLVDQPGRRSRVIAKQVSLYLEQIELGPAKNPNRALHPRALRSMAAKLAAWVTRMR